MSNQKSEKNQVDKFREAARELGADESEVRFNETLRRIGKPNPPKGKKATPKRG